MSLSKTWYTTANRALDDTSAISNTAHSLLWAFGATLCGNVSGTDGPEGARPSSCYWTLVGSSDGTTAGIDATDRLKFGTGFDNTKWTRVTASGSAHTWFVVKSPSGLHGGPWYLCVDYLGVDDQHFAISVSRNVFSGGSTTTRPTSSNSIDSAAIQFSTGVANAGKTYFTCDANGGFRWYASQNGSGFFYWFFALEEVVEARVADLSHTFHTSCFLNSGRGVLNNGASNAASQPQYAGMAENGTTAVPVSTTTQGNFVLSTQFAVNSASRTLENDLTSTNILDSEIDALPIGYLITVAAGHHMLRGRFPDMWAIGQQVAVGSVVPSTGSPERLIAGSYMMPGSVAPSL